MKELFNNITLSLKSTILRLVMISWINDAAKGVLFIFTFTSLISSLFIPSIYGTIGGALDFKIFAWVSASLSAWLFHVFYYPLLVISYYPDKAVKYKKEELSLNQLWQKALCSPFYHDEFFANSMIRKIIIGIIDHNIFLFILIFGNLIELVQYSPETNMPISAAIGSISSAYSLAIGFVAWIFTMSKVEKEEKSII